MVICLYHALNEGAVTCLPRTVLRLRLRLSYEIESKAACTTVHPKARDLYVPESHQKGEKERKADDPEGAFHVVLRNKPGDMVS
jgi:hypothetical protein